MHNRISMKYPRSWTQVRKILKSLDARTNKMKKHSDKKWQVRESIIIAKYINSLHKMALNNSDKIRKKIDVERKSCKADSTFKKPKSLAALMSATMELNFHKKVSRATKEWMKINKIPNK